MLKICLNIGQSEGADDFKQAESRRWCSWSRRHCLFFLMVSAAVLFFYNINIKITPEWNPKQWISFKSWDQGVISSNTNDESITTTELTTVAQSVSEINSSPFVQTTNITSTEVTVTSTQTTQNETMPPTPIPYESQQLYLVEYPYDYHFIINEPHVCEQQKPFLVLMIPVAPNNRRHRDIIRNTWGGENLFSKVVKLFFLLGRHIGEGAENLQIQLLQESKEHQDLIQSDFMDCYKNLTIKTMVMLEWLDSYCANASYAMKVDSDIFLNVPNLVNMLSTAPKTNYMTGLVTKDAAVLRDPKSKWYLPVDLYPNSQYPHYVLGLGYVFSMDLPKKLVEASKHVKALYIEDVYLGLCMQYLGINLTEPPAWDYFNVFPVPYSRCAYSRLIATTTRENTDHLWIWKNFKEPGPYC
ncbi:beta-1,3-galactosyltransferase 2-like [Anabas testudineus]|uniref:Hexosyltransferase n=1 Tax=Anabas testudineus TaxID=64144 RepID=A0A3Q1JJG1_ANATE|nr:beta-1,3-galactosyltransferase 2-like [Anabas testudineus]